MPLKTGIHLTKKPLNKPVPTIFKKNYLFLFYKRSSVFSTDFKGHKNIIFEVSQKVKFQSRITGALFYTL